ncbi:MAG: HEAT repeat domain-containing protein [Elusimicrobia bacterium]|nr:HEAT repeat domain-containing protein [Elusimicrobiota bacterium]
MTARALLAAALLLAAAPARAEEPVSPFERLQPAAEPWERILACAELAKPEHRGPRAYETLVALMREDLSERVRLAAAVSLLTFPGGRTLGQVDAFLKAETGVAVRRELLIALSTEPAHLDNPDATRLIASALAEDASVEVRLGALEALGARADPLALGAIRRASEKDENEDVRDAARRLLRVLAKPPKSRKKRAPPSPDSVFGKDACPRPWGWCHCSGAVKLKPKCLSRAECRSREIEMAKSGLDCRWDGHSQD